MSHALQRLRVVLSDEVLVRAGGEMQLTARAESLRQPLAEILERLSAVLANQAFDPRASSRTFRLFVADNAVDLILPALLSTLNKKAPGVRVEIQSWAAREKDVAELAQAVDIAIACVPEAFPGFYCRRLFTDRDVCVYRGRRASAPRLRTQSAFLESGHAAVRVRGTGEDPVDTWLKSAGFRRNIAVTVPHYLQALHLVARTDLIAVIPERLVRAYATPLRLKWLPLPMDPGTFDELLLHPARTHSDPGCVWLRGLLADIGQEVERG
jgi:DNA-binding transcriptional LysR family regulator